MDLPLRPERQRNRSRPQEGRLQHPAALAGLLAVAAASLLMVPGPSAAQPLQSQPGPGEIDTADRRGGQAGGIGLGVDYELPTLRCGAGEAIVGVRIRRGDVLDSMQIACARPTCTTAGCQWTGEQWGPAAGNPQGGDPHRAMVCAQNAALASFRARVVTFTQFDYTADLEIECAPLTSGPDAQGFFRVGRAVGPWLHPEGGLGRSSVPGNATRSTTTAPITCRPNGAATAFSLGVSKNFVRQGQPVVQAVSLYCPASPPDPSCPETLVVATGLDRSAAIEQTWFGAGGRTAGGMVAVMEARPANRSWRGARLTESVSFNASSCNIRNVQNLCTRGLGTVFEVGVAKEYTNGPLTVPWNPQGTQAQNGFADFHIVLDDRGQPAGVSLLSNLPGPCVVSCRQTYSCGRGAQAVSYGPFTITYTFTRGSYQPRLLGIQSGPAVAVTRVSAAKQ